MFSNTNQGTFYCVGISFSVSNNMREMTDKVMQREERARLWEISKTYNLGTSGKHTRNKAEALQWLDALPDSVRGLCSVIEFSPL
jgi:hypothetical protein